MEAASPLRGAASFQLNPFNVGMEQAERHWYVAVVRRSTERYTRDQLTQLGYESYVATQHEVREWRNGRKKKVERVVISAIIFVHVTEQERLDILNTGLLFRFMTDKARPVNEFGRHPLAIIPDHQMEQLQFMLFHADRPVEFIPGRLAKGTPIRVARGALKGFEGTVLRSEGLATVVCTLDLLGCATISISPEDLEPI